MSGSGGRADRAEERAAATLTAGGPSLLGVDGAMRARDVSQPTPADDAVAERLVQVSFRPRFSAPAQQREPRPADARPGNSGPGGGRSGKPQSDGTGGSSPDAS